MSTALYAVASTNRDNAEPKESTKSRPPGMRTFLDALAALVPGEALALHALALNLYTGPIKGPNGKTGTQITDINDLQIAFYVCVVMSIIVYITSRLLSISNRPKKWSWLDLPRGLIPAVAFALWTMGQRTTAFDAAFPTWDMPSRYFIAAVGAIFVGIAAAALGYIADADQPPAQEDS